MECTIPHGLLSVGGVECFVLDPCNGWRRGVAACVQWLEAQGSPSRECRLSEALGGHSEGQCTCESQPKARCRWPGRVLDGQGNAHATTAFADVLSGDFDFHLLAAAVSSHGHGDGGLLPCSTTRCPMRMACALAGRRLFAHLAMSSVCDHRATRKLHPEQAMASEARYWTDPPRWSRPAGQASGSRALVRGRELVASSGAACQQDARPPSCHRLSW